jgi:hypothetical protein
MTTMIRILRLTDAPDVTIPVRIYAPVPEPLDWSCRAEISWPDGQWARDVTGIDALHAHEMALRFVGTELYMSDLHKARRLVWLERGQGYGFPVPVVIRDLLVGEDRRRFG